MKLLVMLVLAVLAGCDGRRLQQRPQPKQQVDMVKDAFWEYVAKATSSAEESLRRIRLSELGQDVNNLIAESSRTAHAFTAAMRTQVAPLTQELMVKMGREAEHLKARVEADLGAAGAEELLSELQRRVGGLKSAAAPYARAVDPEALRAVVLQRSRDLRAQLEAQMVPLAQEVKQKVEQSLEEFRRSLVPAAQSFQKQLGQGVRELQESLAPLRGALKVKLSGDAQQLRKQLAALWESFTQMMQ